MTLSPVLLAVSLLGAQPHADNPVFTQLTVRGVSIGAAKPVRLPEPTMPDGLDATAQRDILARIAGQAYPLPRFVRNSAVAPHVLKQKELTESSARGRQVDAWFVAYGTLDRLFERDFQDHMLLPEDDQDVASQGHALGAQELKSRDIAWDAARAQVESFGHGSLSLWKRVTIAATVRSYCTRSDDSVVVAAVVDSRFDEDRQFPNRWWPLQRNAAGATTEGKPHTYPGMGVYFKATRLVEPTGALLVECHLVLAEPHEWFDGANLLGSKLPAIVQSRVRSMRRELAVVPSSAPAKSR